MVWFLEDLLLTLSSWPTGSLVHKHLCCLAKKLIVIRTHNTFPSSPTSDLVPQIILPYDLSKYQYLTVV